MADKQTDDSGIFNESITEDDLLQENDDILRGVIQKAVDVPCTSSEDMKKIKLYDNTIEIVGFVENVEPSRLIGRNNLLIFKFLVNNGDGERIQVIAWNDEVSRTEAVVRKDMIIHIEGAYGKLPKAGFPNKGTVNVELIIENYTIINILGKRQRNSGMENITSSKTVATPFQLAQVGDSMIYSEVEGFIKLNFVLVKSHGSNGQSYGSGSITDGYYMLRIRIIDYNDEHDFNKGDHVKVRGHMRRTANPIYFSVNSIYDVNVIDDTKMEFIQLLRGVNEIDVKRASNQVDFGESNSINAKKAKVHSEESSSMNAKKAKID